MRRFAVSSLLLALSTLLSACSGGGPPGAGTPVTQAAMVQTQGRAAGTVSAQLHVDVASGSPSGYAPADIQSAYNLPSSSDGAGQLIAIVSAYDDPNAASDLGTYRSTFDLAACGATNACFTKVNQDGQQSNYPQPNASWALSAALSIEMVSAACPNCSILLVEATSNSERDLERSVDEAVKLGAVAVSAGYSGATSAQDERHYRRHGVIFVAPGDAQNGGPAAYPSVVSVGGTVLRRSTKTKRGWTETAFGYGGCSTYPKPPWQHDTFCTTRTMNDVAAVASPGVAVYDSYGYAGWVELSGTSVSTPIVAAVYGLAGNAGALFAARSIYEHHGALFSIPPKGYDEASGWGSPNGIGAF